mmetsp:Transcript_80603/g.159608  ORF Transcript_80603/g.159608 Transcript_80603/m.159608 type:complete len:204 (+) Transcript_80603:414-1025(+)
MLAFAATHGGHLMVPTKLGTACDEFPPRLATSTQIGSPNGSESSLRPCTQVALPLSNDNSIGKLRFRTNVLKQLRTTTFTPIFVCRLLTRPMRRWPILGAKPMAVKSARKCTYGDSPTTAAWVPAGRSRVKQRGTQRKAALKRSSSPPTAPCRPTKSFSPRKHGCMCVSRRPRTSTKQSEGCVPLVICNQSAWRDSAIEGICL